MAMPEERLTTGLEWGGLAPAPYIVRRVLRETRDTFTLKLEPVNGHPPRFNPGQFNMLYAFGIGEVPISISGDPEEPRLLTHTIRAVGAVTRAITTIGKGGVLGVRGPYGNGWPLEEAVGSDILIVAGGLGLAPLRPAIYHLQRHREKYGRVVLLYGARTPEDLLYRRELMKWRARFDMDVDVTVDTAVEGWRGNVGVVTTLIPGARVDVENTIALVCGPEIMMRFTIRELNGLGLQDQQIYISMERNMKCATGFCGHCQFGPAFICKNGPVFRYDVIKPFFTLREV
jgi:NAD(P)H-flavin reductase